MANLSDRKVPDPIYRHKVYTGLDHRRLIQLGATSPNCDPIAKPPVQMSVDTILEPNHSGLDNRLLQQFPLHNSRQTRRRFEEEIVAALSGTLGTGKTEVWSCSRTRSRKSSGHSASDF